MIPVLFFLICVFLVVAPIVQNPRIETLYAVLFVVGGVLVYIPAFHFKLKPAFLSKSQTLNFVFCSKPISNLLSKSEYGIACFKVAPKSLGNIDN